MPSISVPVAIAAGAGISAIGSVAGGAIQANAATNAADLQQQRYLQTRSDLLPFIQGGAGAFGQYNALAPFSFNPTMAQLEQTPGYQFTLNQGLKATQNAAAARGLGVSGAALKGAAGYSTGLAASTWPEVFNAAQQVYTTNANKLLQGATIGQNAAAQTGTIGAQLAGNQGNALITAGGAIGGGLASAGLTAASALTNPYLLGAFGSQTPDITGQVGQLTPAFLDPSQLPSFPTVAPGG